MSTYLNVTSFIECTRRIYNGRHVSDCYSSSFFFSPQESFDFFSVGAKGSGKEMVKFSFFFFLLRRMFLFVDNRLEF